LLETTVLQFKGVDHGMLRQGQGGAEHSRKRGLGKVKSVI
jgi:hypothetical protein